MFSKLKDRLIAVVSAKPVVPLPPTIKAANEVINEKAHKDAHAPLVPVPVPTPPEPKVKPMTVTGNAKNIKRIVIHCTATREGQDISVDTIRGWHKRQGWSDIGYHFVIGLDGQVERGRPEHVPGSHVKGFNTGSIGVVYVGGLDAQAKGKDTRTPAQKRAMADLVKALLKAYPASDVMGHRDLSPDKDGDGVVERHEWLKECPCFDVRAWWASV
jgi:N-acetylmuramoyl-L-alanine amidase